MADQELPQKKIFSYAEAAALLPEVQRLTEAAHRRVEAIDSSHGDEAHGRAASIAAEWARSVMELGAEVKGAWLVDFDNGSGYYCWRYPESGLRHYHSYEEGFRGRMPIQ